MAEESPEELPYGESIGEKSLILTNKPLTARDVMNLEPDPVYSTNQTVLTASFVVEDIRIPPVDVVKVLSVSSNIWNKSKSFLDDLTDSVVYASTTNNFITNIGTSVDLKVGGDLGTNHKIVVINVDNKKYYNWDTGEFGFGYNAFEGEIDGEKILLNIPPVSTETTYNVYFENTAGVSNESDLPTKDSPWVINQLVDATTTFKFEDSEGYIPDQTSTKVHAPGVVLNAGSTNDGKIDITVTTLVIRGNIALNSDRLNDSKVYTNDVVLAGTDDEPEVLETDLVVSVDADTNTGTITGTIILGKSSLRDTNVTFEPSEFFTIT